MVVGGAGAGGSRNGGGGGSGSGSVGLAVMVVVVSTYRVSKSYKISIFDFHVSFFHRSQSFLFNIYYY